MSHDSGDAGLGQLAGLSASAMGTLVTVATNPEEWLRGILNRWVVGGILDAAAFVLGWFLFAYDRMASIIADAAGPLATPFQIIEDAVVGAIETLYGAAIGVAHSAGLAGPPAAALAVAVVMTVVAALAFGLIRVLPGSDFFEGSLEAVR